MLANTTESSIRKCPHSVYWPEDHELPYGCGFCNPDHYDSVMNERPEVPLNMAYQMYVAFRTNDYKEAFGEALHKYLFRILRRTYTVQETPADLVQSAALAVWADLDKFKGDSSFTTWVSSLVANTTSDSISRTLKLREYILLIDIGKKGPSSHVEAKLTLKSLISKLDNEDQQLVQMKLDGLTEEEIGEAFNTDAKWANNKWTYIKKSMQQVETVYMTKEPTPRVLQDVKPIGQGLRTATLGSRSVILTPNDFQIIRK